MELTTVKKAKVLHCVIGRQCLFLQDVRGKKIGVKLFVKPLQAAFMGIPPATWSACFRAFLTW